MSRKTIYILLLVLLSLELISCRTRTKNEDSTKIHKEQISINQDSYSNDKENSSTTEEGVELKTDESEETNFETEVVTEYDIVKNDDGTYRSNPKRTTSKTKGKINKKILTSLSDSSKVTQNSKSNIDSTSNELDKSVVDSTNTKKSAKAQQSMKSITTWLFLFVILFFIIALIYRFRRVILPFLKI